MSNRGTASVGSWVEFQAAVLRQLPRPEDADASVFDGWANNQAGLKKVLASVLLPPTGEQDPWNAQKQIGDWVNLYRKYFGITLGDVQVPEHQSGFDRLIVVVKGLTMNRVYEVCAKQFPCWRYVNDLDASVTKNDRDPRNGTYVIWVRDREEADEELKNLSADQLATQKIPGETLPERMLHELKCWDETGKHMDVRNWTLCSGSRGSDGSVPSADWDSGGFGVGWFDSDSRGDFLRSRSVVSLS